MSSVTTFLKIKKKNLKIIIIIIFLKKLKTIYNKFEKRNKKIKTEAGSAMGAEPPPKWPGVVRPYMVLTIWNYSATSHFFKKIKIKIEPPPIAIGGVAICPKGGHLANEPPLQFPFLVVF
jgi:hypothetical protein